MVCWATIDRDLYRGEELMWRSMGENWPAIRNRVNRARDLQLARFRGSALYCYAQMGARVARMVWSRCRRRPRPHDGVD